MFVYAADYQDNWKEIRKAIDYLEIYDALGALSVKSQDYAQAVFQADKDNALTNSIQNIAGSIIHMFCNRLKGDNRWERRVYALARHATYDLTALLAHRG